MATCCVRAAECSTEMCAERRLLEKVVSDVGRRGRRPTVHSVRKALGVICVERRRADGSLGCSAPCCGCCMALAQYDVRVRFWDGKQWRIERSADLVGSQGDGCRSAKVGLAGGADASVRPLTLRDKITRSVFD